jgi:2-polyprenyl-3-methyl-5-hydroxy-6-metoxy-1,4-benzoquinol methylase
MSRHTDTLPASYFETKYRDDIDPWQFRTSDYEREKYDATLAALTRPHYPSILEVGCSIGIFSTQLATRCDTLLAIDASATALDAARKNAPDNVVFEERTLPEGFPQGRFDLIVLSEVLYYFKAEDLDEVARKCCAALAPGGEFLLCHWLGETNYPLTGHEASERFAQAVAARTPLRRIFRDEVYRLERLS